MSFLKEETWNGQVYSGGWVTPEGGDAAVIEPATGRELGRIGIATPADVTRAV
jgi:benzaldehyde dehydrogenase (NAD)